jgi:hypothetical protein
VLFGEGRYGEKCAQIFDSVGIKEKTIRNWVYTCKNVPRENRLPASDLSYSHHHVVASLDHNSQRKALQYALKNALSVVEFKLWLAGSKNPVKDASEYYEKRRLNVAKTEALPEGLSYQPWAVERQRQMVDRRKVKGQISNFDEWFDDNEERVELIADVREACKFVWDGCLRTVLKEAE